jgi:hypothetical protein
VLLYMVLFNHQAERASFVIAFAGMAIWFASEPRARWRSALFGLAFVTMPLMSTLVPVTAALRSPAGMVYRLTLPTFVIWIVLQVELWRAHRLKATPPSGVRGGELPAARRQPTATLVGR